MSTAILKFLVILTAAVWLVSACMDAFQPRTIDPVTFDISSGGN